jgi:protein PET117
MSRASKLTLAGTSLGAIGIVVLVHYQQQSEKAVSIVEVQIESRTLCLHCAHRTQAMHAGVVRDIEQQRVKKERQADFEMQRALEEEYRKVQKVHDGGQEFGGRP